MIRLKRGSAALLAVLLTLHLAVFPLRACAMSVTMAAVGGAVVVSAALVACGIYPYISEGETFGEWGAQKLSALWGQYVDSFQDGSLPSGGTVETFNQIKAYVTGRTLVIAQGVRENLAAFISWLRGSYATTLSDDMDSVALGQAEGMYARLPIYYHGGHSGHPSRSVICDKGLRLRYYVNVNGEDVTKYQYFLGQLDFQGQNASGQDVYDYALSNTMCFVFYSGFDGGYYLIAASRLKDPTGSDSQIGVNIAFGDSFSTSYYSFGQAYKNGNYFSRNGNTYYFIPISCEGTIHGVPVYNSLDDVKNYISNYYSEVPWPSVSGIVVDTGAVSVPEVFSSEAVSDEGSQWVGLAVYPGTVEGVADTPASPMTAEKVEQVIQQGVTERQRPEIRPVAVTFAPGTTLDAETGVVSSVTVTDMGETTDTGESVDAGVTVDAGAVAIDSGVTLDVTEIAENYVPAVSELAVPQAFLDSIAATMTTKFPFCLPFDAMRVLRAFAKTPQAPVISLTIHDPFTNADYTVMADLSPWDDVAAMLRQLEAICLLALFSLNFDKFNVLNVILGNIS